MIANTLSADALTLVIGCQTSKENSAFIGNSSPQDGETYPLFPNAKGNSSNNNINTKNGSNQNYGNNNDKPKYNENLICQICEKLGHGAWKCYQRNTHQQQTSSYSMSKVVDPLPSYPAFLSLL
ncbi:PREDICTED: uncharacterized protein LOC101306648 [Fragaria vesca subsp. vesca]